MQKIFLEIQSLGTWVEGECDGLLLPFDVMKRLIQRRLLHARCLLESTWTPFAAGSLFSLLGTWVQWVWGPSILNGFEKSPED